MFETNVSWTSIILLNLHFPNKEYTISGLRRRPFIILGAWCKTKKIRSEGCRKNSVQGASDKKLCPFIFLCLVNLTLKKSLFDIFPVKPCYKKILLSLLPEGRPKKHFVCENSHHAHSPRWLVVHPVWTSVKPTLLFCSGFAFDSQETGNQHVFSLV